MPRPCVETHPPSPEKCRVCWLIANEPWHCREEWLDGGTRPLRIIHVGTSMALAGAELQLASLVKYLDPARAKITKCVVTLTQAFDKAFADSLGVPVVVDGRDAVREAAKGCDVMLCWGGGLDSWLAGVKPPLVVFIAHGEGRWTRHALEGCAKTVDHVVAVSKAAKRKVCEGFPTTVIPNGIDLSRTAPTLPREALRARFSFAPEDTVLLYCGRFSDEKRPHAVIEAVELLPPNYKAVLVGWGDGEKALRKLAGEKIPGRHHFAKAVNDVGDYYSLADCLVACSDNEGDSLAIKEAMFAGLPVIATPVGAVPEMNEGRDLFRIVDGSGTSIAASMPPDQGRASRARAFAEEHCHAKTMADSYCDLLERLWRRRSKPKVNLGAVH